MAATGNEENKARSQEDLKQTEIFSNRIRYDFDDDMMRRIVIHPSTTEFS
jgi:radical SAM superfamily enzyme with C-terminal helix-hairpin-helix motif